MGQKWPPKPKPLVEDEERIFKEEITKAELVRNRALDAVHDAEDLIDKLILLENISLDMIHYDNPNWLRLVSTELRKDLCQKYH